MADLKRCSHVILSE